MANSDRSLPRDSVEKSGELFKSLEFNDSRTTRFWTSLGVHGVLLTILLIVPLIFTDTIRAVRYDLTFLAPPPPRRKILEVTPYKLPPPPKPKPEPRKIEKPLELPKVAEIKPPELIVKPKPVPLITKNLPIPEPAPPTPAPPPPPKPEVRTNVFPSESTAPTVNLPPRQVQTGGFGDPNGARGEGRPGKVVNVASLGSFDLPTGDGAGNGTGGARGARAVTSAGFGNGAAAAGDSKGPARSVRQGAFGDVDATQPAAGPKKQDAGPPQVPAEILFKPRPEYTEDARNRKLEGEVLLRVMFTSTGEVRVLDVVRGLGHGLDESAVHAAQQIRFKPAQRDGHAVDSTATVHIVFQLAY
jgi:TonB family protein